jgi:hypothetical protein
VARYDGRSIRRNKKTSDVDSQEYWENILRQEGLSMSRGRHSRLSYFSPAHLERIEEARFADGKAGVEPDSSL